MLMVAYGLLIKEQKIGSQFWDPGLSDLGQDCVNLPHLSRHPQKI